MAETATQSDMGFSRTRLSGLAGRQYWRSLEELSGSPQFEEFLHREFPEQASEWQSGGASRREFLVLMGASLALAGLTGCAKRPEEKIIPYVQPPEEIIPGRPLFYASAMPFRGYGIGTLVETHMARPTKVEGNPQHPASLGASNAWMQASVLTLWDPDRAQTVSNAGQVSTWSVFLQTLDRKMRQLADRQGQGLRILTETVTSPTLADQLAQLLKRYPQARWHHYEPVGRDSARGGAKLAFGRDVNTIHRFDKAKRILSLDADFLLADPGSLRYARQFVDQRRMWLGKERTGDTEFQPPASAQAANRLYVAQSTPTITGAMADHRLVMKASQIEPFARAVAHQLGLQVNTATPLPANQEAWITALVRDLNENRGASLIIAGEQQPPFVHALAHAMNEALGNIGQTVSYTEPIESHPDEPTQSLIDLVRDMHAGQVDTLVILGANPVFTAPADLQFVAAMDQVKLRIHHSLYYDETSYYCHWHIPESHFMEAWGDVRAFDGTASIIQPQLHPLYQTKSAHELLAAFLGQQDVSGMSLVQDYWRRSSGAADFNAFWSNALERGIIPRSEAPPIQVSVRKEFLSQPASAPAPGAADGSLEIIFRPDPTIWDGRFANNGWLQELPKPLTKLTWDNAAMISPATAAALNLADAQHTEQANGKMLLLRYQGRQLEMPAWVVPGHPDGAVTVHLGYGRERAGRVGTATGKSGGFNAYVLRGSGAMAFGSGLQVTQTGKHYRLATTQAHQVIEGHDLIHSETLATFLAQQSGAGAGAAEPGRKVHLSLYPEAPAPAWNYQTGHRWAMEIDTNACIGCNACVVACQSENNIPVVGKEQVLNTREMHWIRIDSYFTGPAADPQAYFQPVPCMHCEKAPCEVVCPVAATTHSAEGLNEMTYNRCVGTRYCSNNCPYKVRRFNFLHYSKVEPAQLMLMKNPDVTVRERGVMEKCTYCVQRLNQTRVELKKLQVQAIENESPESHQQRQRQADALMDSLQTACQQACPTHAIIFGDLNYRDSAGRPMQVAALRQQPQDYGLLTELNTEPRTRYLPRFRNPNPEIPEATA